jgi:SAM-dependent methyltransferase
MSSSFDAVKAMYAREFKAHGDSPASLLTPKGRQQLRFRVADDFVRGPGTRVLDYGCGLGYFYQHLKATGAAPDYTGVDILSEFVEACRKKFPEPNARFELLSPTAPLAVAGPYDVVFLSGVFNIKLNRDADTSRAYTFARLRELFAATRGVLICDFLSGYVDFRQDDSMHFSVGEIADFCATELSRRFTIRHDLLPYEFTLIVHRDAAIKRPENIFLADDRDASAPER